GTAKTEGRARESASPEGVSHTLFFVNRTCDGFCFEHIGISIYSAGKNLSKNRITGPNKRRFMKAAAKSLFGIWFSLTLLSPAVWAQATAQISGTVADQSGARLPGAEVTATQTGTGLSRTVVSNETGTYILASLPTGPYKLEVALPGFRSFVQTGIVLDVN